MIDILLPTFNRAEYLPELLRSIEGQSYNDWRIIARDDASSDRTQDVLDAWRNRLGSRISLADDSGIVNLGCPGNFSKLLKASEADYVMLADPDDVWLPNKISLAMDSMKHLEAQFGAASPCLVSADVSVVDNSLNVINPSFWAYQGVHPRRRVTMNRFLVENSVWGCTILANRSLVQLAGCVPEESFHADWWFGLVAATFGRIEHVPAPAVLWRRHGNNTSEASSIVERTKEMVRSPHVSRSRVKGILEENVRRAGVFSVRYSHMFTKAQRRALDAFLVITASDPIARRLMILRHQFFFTSFRRNVALLLLV